MPFFGRLPYRVRSRHKHLIDLALCVGAGRGSLEFVNNHNEQAVFFYQDLQFCFNLLVLLTYFKTFAHFYIFCSRKFNTQQYWIPELLGLKPEKEGEEIKMVNNLESAFAIDIDGVLFSDDGTGHFEKVDEKIAKHILKKGEIEDAEEKL